ncbi:hypothetical protein KFL_004300110 [Klebsormidium nitens]|uniref:MYND-type domain-containing protein n=1 Tax=Klebsormidium nitens TaxID=105231 RepID=A0A1Y1IC24_KLENI|nr:hypothetical protein KFL_004300110 [Klebsormidium nitens]|eukprot:GAQ88460.1 hypothetical protein KFL_004300110 [Klebsormidium nitens]
MEHIVEYHANKLQSERYEDLKVAVEYIEALRVEADYTSEARIRFSRLLQELLAYKRGAVIHKILQQMRRAPPNAATEIRKLRTYSTTVLVALSENQAVAQYCVREEHKTRVIARALLDSHTILMNVVPDQLRGKRYIPDHLVEDPSGEGERYKYLNLAVENVRGFVNFSRASRTFRLVLQELDGLFPALESLVAREITELASTDILRKTVKYMHRLMDTFALFEDSQQWALDKGMIRIHAAIQRLLGMEGVIEADNAAVEMFNYPDPTSVATRWYIASGEKMLLDLDEKIRESRGNRREVKRLRTEYLESVKAHLTATGPVAGAANGLFSGAPNQDPQTFAKSLTAWASGRTGAPIVCSWELCETGSVVDAGRPFSKCSSCMLAYYCRFLFLLISKEHQKLHWRSHKKHCQDTKP